MARYKIVYNRKECIGAAACVALSEKYWVMDEDNKANLKGSKLNEETGLYELEFDESDLEEVKESAMVCPVEIIYVYKIEDDGKLTKIEL